MTETSSFPHSKLTPFEPKFRSLQTLKQQVYANAMAIPSFQGGAFGHYSLTVTDATYQEETGGAAFIPPVHPGEDPEVAANATGPQIQEANRRHKQAVKTYDTYKSTESNLKQQILDAVPDLYISRLKDQKWGYANVKISTILELLTTKYGEKSEADYDSNLQDLYRQWNPDELPMEELWSNVHSCIQFAADGNPITDMTAVQAVVAILTKTGLFEDSLTLWHHKPKAEHTLANAELHFEKGNQVRLTKLTAKQAGYHGANQATTTQPTTAEDIALAAEGNNNKTTPAVTHSVPKGWYYCWSHGQGTNPAHTSATCTNQAPGHCEDATFGNMRGGNNSMMRRRNERPVWKKPNPTGK